jgi:hypothetical protein
MTGAELKALIPDDCGVYITDGSGDVLELMPEDVMKDADGDYVLVMGESEDEDQDEEDGELEDEEEEIEV